MELEVLVRIPSRFSSDPIDFLLRQKFPDLPLLQEGHVRSTNPTDVERFRDMERAATKYYEELTALPTEEVQRLFEEARNKELEAKRAAQEAKFWFNQPNLKPDHHRWAAMPFWTLEEAVALSLDREPDRVKLEALEGFLQVSKLAALFAYRFRLADRARKLNKITNPIIPPVFIRWAQSNGVILPVQLIESVEAAHGVHRNWEDEAKRLSGVISELQRNLETALADNASLRAELESKPIPQDERERTSLLKLVAGMAVGGYGFDPKAARSPATKEIADDLQRNGIALDEDTVRKYLQLAKAIIEEHQTE